MSMKTDSTKTTKTSQGKMRFTDEMLRLDQASRARQTLFRLTHLAIEGCLTRNRRRRGLARVRRRRKRLRGRLARCNVDGFVDRLVRIHELVAQLVRGAAELADHAADVPRHPWHPLRTEDDERD